MRWLLRSAGALVLSLLLLLVFPDLSSASVPAPDRLWIVGSRAFEDTLYALAHRELGRFLEAFPDDPRRGDALFLRAKAAFALGRYAEALGEFEAAEFVPLTLFTPGEPIYWQGEALFKLRRFAEAQERYARFVRAYPTSSLADDALYARGWCALELGWLDEALGSFRKLLADWPESPLAPSAAYALVRELAHAGRWKEALPVLETYATRYPGSPWLGEIRYLRGVAEVEVGEVGAGIKTLRRFLEQHQGHEVAPNARWLLAESLAREKKEREAMAQYRQLADDFPRHPLASRALFQAGELARQLGLAKDAEGAWEALRSGYPDDPLTVRAGLQMADFYFKRRLWARALETAQGLVDGPAEVGLEAALLAGESALKLGRQPTARTAFEAALTRAVPGSPEAFRARAGLALVHEATGELAKAREAYQAIVEEADDQELVRWAKARLAGVRAQEKKLEKPPHKAAPPGRPK